MLESPLGAPILRYSAKRSIIFNMVLTDAIWKIFEKYGHLLPQEIVWFTFDWYVCRLGFCSRSIYIAGFRINLGFISNLHVVILRAVCFSGIFKAFQSECILFQFSQVVSISVLFMRFCRTSVGAVFAPSLFHVYDNTYRQKYGEDLYDAVCGFQTNRNSPIAKSSQLIYMFMFYMIFTRWCLRNENT